MAIELHFAAIFSEILNWLLKQLIIPLPDYVSLHFQIKNFAISVCQDFRTNHHFGLINLFGSREIVIPKSQKGTEYKKQNN